MTWMEIQWHYGRGSFSYLIKSIILIQIILSLSLVNSYNSRWIRRLSTQQSYPSRPRLRETSVNMILNSNNNPKVPEDFLRSSLQVDDIVGLANSRGLRPTLLENVETDYLGMIDFCLRPNDNALSGPSRSKVLNALTNDIFKALIIGFEPLIQRIYSRLDEYKEQIRMSECEQFVEDIPVDGQTAEQLALRYTACEFKQKDDLLKANEYVARLEKLLTEGIVYEDVLGSYVYDCGYKRLLTALRDAGCKFPSSYSTSSNTSKNTRPFLIDKNICLSLLDLNPSKRNTGNTQSKTMELNTLSNYVSRTILYGGKDEKDVLIDAIEQSIKDFANRWKLQNMDCQEIRYLQALILLLQVGISKAEEAVTSIESPIVFDTENSEKHGLLTLNPVTLKDEKVINTTSMISSYRLFDSYLNAFHRVVEVCLSEISTRLSRDMNLQNDDLLLNFVQWEQSLRRNLTSDLWKQNPGELAGVWEFVDVKGDGGLRSLLINSDEYFEQENPNGNMPDRSVLAVELTRDGKVQVKAGTRSTAVGKEWFFRPGPAHLDTCEFFVTSSSDGDMLLRYIGFIDRGQRIESRFSKSPIRMTGRVLTLVKGEMIGNCRFIMVLRR